MINASALCIPLKDESVDLVITSPPFFNVRADNGVGDARSLDEYLQSLWSATREMGRVLKPRGSIFINVGDRYSSPGGTMRNQTSPASNFAARRVTDDRYGDRSRYGNIPAKSLMGIPWRYANGCIDGEAGSLWLRAEIIWFKKNPLPESHYDRVWRSHEQWFHLSVSPTPWCSKRARVEAKTPGRKPRMPGSVWEMGPNTEKVSKETYEMFGIERHDAPFSPEWPERFIRGWCPKKGVVLDPFSGTGTVGMVATHLGMQAICIDLDFRYSALSAWRSETW